MEQISQGARERGMPSATFQYGSNEAQNRWGASRLAAMKADALWEEAIYARVYHEIHGEPLTASDFGEDSPCRSKSSIPSIEGMDGAQVLERILNMHICEHCSSPALEGFELSECCDDAQSPIPIGTSVTVCGLAAKPEFNGQIGVVKSYTLATGRLMVQLGDVAYGGKCFSLKPTNLAATAVELD